jgi:fermentation-respiration switch protein FrsA (DUF1100 family)
VPRYGSRAEPQGALKVKRTDGSQLTAVFLRNPNARFTLWYFHGNAEALGDIGDRLRELKDLGFSVFAVEYPGYGTNFESPTEAKVYETIEVGLRYLRDEMQIRLEDVVVYGRSLGGGPAVELASREKVAGLVLESTFSSAYRVMTRWPILPGDKFCSLRKMPKVTCPVLIIHGRSDGVISFRHGKLLYEAAPTENKQHLWVDFAGHNDLLQTAGDSYRRAITDFAAKL